MDLKQVISFVQRNGYETVEKLNNWNGYECYEPIMDSKKETELGPPLLILVKGDKIERLKEDIKYLEDMEKDPNYDGTTPLGLALDLESTLETWN